MAPGSILSIQIHSDRAQYELYEVWFNTIDHIHTYGAAKVNMFFSWVFYGRIFSGFSSSMALSYFQMAPGSILSTQISSDRSQYELYEVWFNKIDHIHTYGAAKVNMFFPGCSTVGFSVGFQVVWHCHFSNCPRIDS